MSLDPNLAKTVFKVYSMSFKIILQGKSLLANFDLTTAKETTSNLERYCGSDDIFQGLL